MVGTILLIIAACIILKTATVPASRPFLVYDATISLPHLGNGSIPFWVVPLVPLIALLLSCAVFEWLAVRACITNVTGALAATLHFFIEFVGCGVVTLILTETTKVLVGRYRPDWLAQCNPAVPSSLNVTYGLPPSDNPACQADLSLTKQQDGHKSFISGHASAAFSLGLFVAFYCLWAAFHRLGKVQASKADGRLPSYGARFLADVGGVATLFWVLLNISWAW